MVLKGQFLERSVVVESGGLMLDALFHRGARPPACAIASPHPALGGGSMVAPAVAELAWALTQAGHATLRFDYRGVGASQGKSRQIENVDRLGSLRRIEPFALADEVADLRAACDQLGASAGAGIPLCCIGYSFGAAVALQAAQDDRVARLVLVAPPTALADFTALGQLRKPVLVVCAHQDPLSDSRALGRLLDPLGDLGLLEVIPHADHGFRRGLPELGRTVAAWLRDGEPLSELAGAAGAPAEARPGEDVGELTLPEGDGGPLELDDSDEEEPDDEMDPPPKR
jgi:alpha/beta superfamily hydrolase